VDLTNRSSQPLAGVLPRFSCEHAFIPGRARPRQRWLSSVSLDGIAMTDSLTSFWIVPRGAPLAGGFGVTAFSEEDALRLIHAAGYQLPADTSDLEIRSGVRPEDIDAKHISPNAGPTVVRGIWYPLTRVGV
jgi:hypothetical protein